MSTSRRYKELQAAVRKLRKALLPETFDSTGNYRSPERVHLRAISFRILVHAEVEQFIEERGYELFDEAWKAWESHRVPSRTLSSLLAFSGFTMCTPPSSVGAVGKIDCDNMDAQLNRAKNHWKNEVYKKNNGVKETNVLDLLLPLGIDGKILDTTLLADLNSFGGRRGAVAHKSSVRVGSFADPKDEFNQAKQLVAALVSIDDLVARALDELNKTKTALSTQNP
jgi:hypothetical protein